MAFSITHHESEPPGSMSRATGMQQGIPSSAAPLISYDWQALPTASSGFYNWDYHDLGHALPWLGLRTVPPTSRRTGGKGQTSIRAGFGIVYDRVGESLADTFDQNGSLVFPPNGPILPISRLPLTAPESQP